MQQTSSPIVAGAAVRGPAVQSFAAEEPQQYLTFVLGTETFAIGILKIKEIIEYAGLTSVPMMPACIRGVINLRGAVVPVLDLCARFGREARDISKRTCIVIVEVETDGERQDLGVIVDAVNEVLAIPASEIEPPPRFGAGIRAEFICGMGKVAGKFVIILDTDRVLSAEEQLAIDGTPATHGGTSAAN
jgi:purine-binding chemotaxis protein CheW